MTDYDIPAAPASPPSVVGRRRHVLALACRARGHGSANAAAASAATQAVRQPWHRDRAAAEDASAVPSHASPPAAMILIDGHNDLPDRQWQAVNYLAASVTSLFHDLQRTVGDTDILQY